MTPTFRRTAGVAVTLVSLTLAACGTTDAEDSDDTGPSTSSPAGDTATPDGCEGVETEDTGPIELTDDLGRTIELDGPAEQVAVLEWQQVEDVLSLCLTPVAVADVDGYRTWTSAEPLPDGVTDVGTRQEPNLDTLFRADPDLVVVEATAADDALVGQLEDYDVPVLATTGADAADPVGNMLGTFRLIAESVGRSGHAEEVVTEFEDALDQARDDIAAADLEQTDFVYFDGYISGGNVALRPFGPGSLVGDLGEEVGLTNVWSGEVDPAYGLGQTDIEGMTAIGEATIFHTATDDGDYADVVDELESNDIWASLPAVTDDRVYPFPVGVWTFGGPRSAIQVVETYVDLLTD